MCVYSRSVVVAGLSLAYRLSYCITKLITGTIASQQGHRRVNTYMRTLSCFLCFLQIGYQYVQLITAKFRE